jgi:hypothetical protein
VKAAGRSSNLLAESVGLLGIGKEMEEWASVGIGSPWNRMKPPGSHTTTDRTNRRQEQESRMAL